MAGGSCPSCCLPSYLLFQSGKTLRHQEPHRYHGQVVPSPLSFSVWAGLVVSPQLAYVHLAIIPGCLRVLPSIPLVPSFPIACLTCLPVPTYILCNPFPLGVSSPLPLFVPLPHHNFLCLAAPEWLPHGAWPMPCPAGCLPHPASTVLAES